MIFLIRKQKIERLIQFMIKLRLNLRELIIVQNIENKTNYKFNDIIDEPTKLEEFFKSIYVKNNVKNNENH